MAIAAPLRPHDPPAHTGLEVGLGTWIDANGTTFELRMIIDPAVLYWYAQQTIRPYNTGSQPFAIALGTPFLTFFVP